MVWQRITTVKNAKHKDPRRNNTDIVTKQITQRSHTDLAIQLVLLSGLQASTILLPVTVV